MRTPRKSLVSECGWPGPACLLRARVVRACLVCAYLACFSCDQKDRSNPLDPGNPETHGSPPGFTAVALDRSVALRWEPLHLERLVGLNLYRRQAGSQSFELLMGSPFPAQSGAAVDSAVTNGVTYEYQLVPLVRDCAEGIPSPVRQATPGPDFAVVSDGCEGLVRKLSADMRAGVWTAGGFFYPLSVAAAAGMVWLADPYSGVYCLTEEGALLWKDPDPAVPFTVAARQDGLCAIADASPPAVRVLSADGSPVFSISEELQRPSCVAFDAEGHLWLADRGAGFVRKYSSDGTLLASFTGCVEPSLLDADVLENACWVGDVSTGELIKLDSDAAELLRVTLSGTMSVVEADRATGGCWVADATEDFVARVSSDGRVLFRIGKLGGPVSLFAAESGKTWVLGATEARLSVLSAQGELLSAVESGQCPTSVVVLSR
ncbi:MAG: hypothetical protein JW952_07130 [Candidatus Eisenbacteria bacterium]|nr:hypothetical protein [Candidatus Eisenbacteria bacterium]